MKTPGKTERARGQPAIAFLATAGILIIAFAAGCVQQDAGNPGVNGSHETPLTVVVSILPQKQFVEQVAGNRARVVVLVPPGASPHSYEPTPGQMSEIAKASVYIKVGSGIEFERAWMDKIAGINPGMAVFDSSKGIVFLNATVDDDEDTPDETPAGRGAGVDPHIWLSPKNAKIMVENTYQGLAAADPGNASIYRANADVYIQKLDALDQTITREIETSNVRTFMVYHPAWTYFAQDYGLVQIPIEKNGKEPTPVGIANLINQAKADNITVIFASPEYSTRSAEVIANQIGGRVALVDPLAEDYLENIENATRAFSGTG